MPVRETIEAIKGLPDDLPLNHAILHVERLTVADLRELVEEYEKLREAVRIAVSSYIEPILPTDIPLAMENLAKVFRESYSHPPQSPPARSGDGPGDCGKSENPDHFCPACSPSTFFQR